MTHISMFFAVAALVIQAGQTASVESGVKASWKLLHVIGASAGLDVADVEKALTSPHGALSTSQINSIVNSAAKSGNKQAPSKGALGTWIADVLLPHAKATTEAIQKDVDVAFQALEKCGEFMWSAENSEKHAAELLMGEEGQMFVCIKQEQEAHWEETKACELVENYVDNVKGNIPTKVTADAEPSSDAILYFLEQSQAFYTAQKDKFDDLNSECTAARQVSQHMHQSCQVEDHVAQEFYCHMKHGRDSMCGSYSTCFETKSAIFAQLTANAKEVEEANKEHFKKMACSKYLDSGGIMIFDPCADSDIVADTSNLDISYSTAPESQECPEVLQTRRDYSGVTCNEQTGDVVSGTTAPLEQDEVDNEADDSSSDGFVPVENNQSSSPSARS